MWGRQWFHNEGLYRFIATWRKDLVREQKHKIPQRTSKPLRKQNKNTQPGRGRRVRKETPNFPKQMQQYRPPSTETTSSAVSEAEVAVVFLLFNFTPPCRVYLLTQQLSARRTCRSFGSHFAEEVPTVGGRLVVLGASRSIVRRSRNWTDDVDVYFDTAFPGTTLSDAW